MVKGSAKVQGSQPRALVQVDRQREAGFVFNCLDNSLSSRQAKDMRCVVFCLSKVDEATGRTRLGRLHTAE